MPKSYLDPASYKQLQDYTQRIKRDAPQMIGYPVAIDYDYQELYKLFGYINNNVGDPYIDPTHSAHSKQMEREVIDFFARLFRAPADDYWGYTTTGSTEGNLYALYLARTLLPDTIVLHSQAAHYSISKSVNILRMPSHIIRANRKGEMNYANLRAVLAQHRDRFVTIVANIGTTMTEAKDNLKTIHQVLDKVGIKRRFIHCDAALAGIPTAFINPHHPFDFKDGADSITISGHKFIGSPMPCGLVITKRRHSDLFRKQIEYIGAPDATITGSRSGHTSLFMWYAIKRWGLIGMQERVKQSLELAEYGYNQLRSIGWQVFRNPNALTIVLAKPPARICAKWQLATEGNKSHIICMPGMRRSQIDSLVADLLKVKRR